MSIGESAPLLENSQTKTKTPLPKTQLRLILFVLCTEPVSAQYIFPFINQVNLWRFFFPFVVVLVRCVWVSGVQFHSICVHSMPRDFRLTHLQESLFFVSQALTVLYWSRLSDHIGRKPILLVGLAGLSVMFWGLVASRCITGALNGNVGVMKSVIGEITDSTNMARAFVFLPIVFSIGTSIAPLYGGGLAKPHDRWPELFSGSFGVQYPYFLPCIVSALFAAFSFFLTALFFEEVSQWHILHRTVNYLRQSLPSKRRRKDPQSEVLPTDAQIGTPSDKDASPVPIRTLFKTYSVMIPIANYGVLALVDMGFFALLPLFYATPVEIGGLGLSPFAIGLYMSAFGVGDGLFQMLFAARVIDRFGERKVFCSVVLAFFPMIAAFPIMNWVIQVQKGVGPVVWIVIFAQLLSWTMVNMAYAVVYVFITKASPNEHSLGTMHGLSQTTSSITKAMGPATFTSLFAFSKEYNLLEGNLVYVMFLILLCLLVILSRYLPELKKDGE
ncbi:major facilitator superfamily domain-containing protein [Pisolithus sp. B1]|nr:major facilitator superfamily domain-containing protein [Pisolithus sp. B1]